MTVPAVQEESRALFAWPAQAAVGRPVSKNKIYAHSKPAAALRELFVKQVDSIVWAYKLSPETINLPAQPDAPEIEVFEVALKVPELHHAVLRCIDKALPRPILFNLRFENHTQPVAAYKRPNESGGDQWVIGDYHAAPWQSDSTERPGLPLALDLRGLYEQLLRQHLPVTARTGETLADQLTRIALLYSRQKVAVKLESRLNQEKQFNRKVEINAELRTIRQELARLRA